MTAFLAHFPQAQPLAGLTGGILIGCAAATMLLGTGRIAGVSGLLARALGLGRGASEWSVAALFVAGLLVGAGLFEAFAGPIPARYPPGLAVLIAGGLCVGFGTRLGNGCTSGHGVCGLSRLSRRSLAATGVFIASAMATVALVNAMGGAW